MRIAFLLVAVAWGCGDDDSDPCPGGICPADASRDGAVDAPGVDAPGVDALGVDAPGTDTGVCIEAWLCSPWETDGSSDAATRTCTDENACGTMVNKPVETTTLPALDANFYECNVEPIVQRGCSQLGCHGVEEGRGYRVYARGRHRLAGRIIIEPGCLSAGTMHASEDCEGSIECRCWSVPMIPDERRRSFDSARGFALGPDGNPLGDMNQSELLRQPLTGGGFPHQGVFLWGMADADYTTILNWLDGASLGSCNSRN